MIARRRSSQSFLITLLGCLLLVVTAIMAGGTPNEARGAEISATAELSPRNFSRFEGAQLTIQVEGAARSVDVDMPTLDKIRFHSQGQSTMVNMINGSFSSSVSYNYYVEALEDGNYTIPPIKVHAKGETVTTEPLSFTVGGRGNSATSTAPSAVSPGNSSSQLLDGSDDIAFLRVSAKGEHYPGERVPVTIKAYFNQGYRANLNSLPALQGDGVVMEQLSSKPSQTEELIGGNRYNVLTWESALTGVKTGKHQLSFAMDATLLIPDRRHQRTPRSIFGGSSLFDDPFFGSMLSSYQKRPVTVNSKPIDFTVLSLPEADRPADFSGAIGDFRLKVSAAPVRAEVGEPITLTTEISGRGNFDQIQPPSLAEDQNWKSYPVSSLPENVSVNGEGSKKFEQAVVARHSTVDAIPPLSFSYFNPVEKRYITLHSEPIPITLSSSQAGASAPSQAAQTQTGEQMQSLSADPPGSTPAAPTQSDSAQARPQASSGAADQTRQANKLPGLAPPSLVPGSYQQAIRPLYSRGWYIACVLCCLAILLGLLSLRVYRRRSAPREEKLLRRTLEGCLIELEQAEQNNDSSRFLELCRTTIQRQLAARVNLEPAAFSLADLVRLMPDSPLVEIMRAAEESAYAGATLSSGSMAVYRATLKKELEALL